MSLKPQQRLMRLLMNGRVQPWLGWFFYMVFTKYSQTVISNAILLRSKLYIYISCWGVQQTVDMQVCMYKQHWTASCISVSMNDTTCNAVGLICVSKIVISHNCHNQICSKASGITDLPNQQVFHNDRLFQLIVWWSWNQGASHRGLQKWAPVNLQCGAL